jgi:hypothetical protein
MVRHKQRCGLRFAGLAAAACWFAAIVESGFAQDDGRVTIDARRCVELESPDERLACFEEEVSEAERDPNPPTTLPTATRPQAAPQVEIPRVQAQQNRNEADNRTEWVGSITELQERLPRRYLITLDTGQVWEQRVAESYALRVGQRVRIYGSRWGRSHRLEADGVNGFIQVDRVR